MDAVEIADKSDDFPSSGSTVEVKNVCVVSSF